MPSLDTVLAVFDTHDAAEAAVKKLAAEGFAMKSLSVIGKGYHSEEQVTGFYTTGDRVEFWGKQGLFWGGLWGIFFGGLFVTIPAIGPVVALGYIGGTIISMVEGAAIFGGLSALGAALYSIGVPKDSIVAYESRLKADSFLVMVHGSPTELAAAKAILAGLSASSVMFHAHPEVPLPPDTTKENMWAV